MSLFIFLLGCGQVTEVRQSLNPDNVYLKDLGISMDGKSYSGIAVLPLKDRYDITLNLPGDANMVILQTCNRDYSSQEAWDKWYNKRKVSMSITLNEVEKTKACPMFIASFEETDRRNSWGAIIIDSVKNPLPARLFCNGDSRAVSGTSACQGIVGTAQIIRFNEKVIYEEDIDCKGTVSYDAVNNWFEIRGPKNSYCLYTFTNKDKKKHRFINMTYTGVLVRRK